MARKRPRPEELPPEHPPAAPPENPPAAPQEGMEEQAQPRRHEVILPDGTKFGWEKPEDLALAQKLLKAYAESMQAPKAPRTPRARRPPAAATPGEPPAATPGEPPAAPESPGPTPSETAAATSFPHGIPHSLSAEQQREMVRAFTEKMGNNFPNSPLRVELPSFIPKDAGIHLHQTKDDQIQAQINHEWAMLEAEHKENVKTASAMALIFEKYALRTELMNDLIHDADRMVEMARETTPAAQFSHGDAVKLRNRLVGQMFSKYLSTEGARKGLLYEWSFKVRLDELHGTIDKLFPHAPLEERRFDGGAINPMVFASEWEERILERLRAEKQRRLTELLQLGHPRRNPEPGQWPPVVRPHGE